MLPQVSKLGAWRTLGVTLVLIIVAHLQMMRYGKYSELTLMYALVSDLLKTDSQNF